MDYSPADLLTLARLCDAAYMDQEPARAATEALGMTYIGMPANAGCTALVAAWGGLSVVAFQGTRLLEDGFSIPEFWDDINGCIVRLSDGTRVHAGFWEPLAALWPSIVVSMPPGQPLLTGHSLGGTRAHLGKAMCPGAEVVSLGAPKAADDAFWSRHYPVVSPLRLVNGRDPAPAWPWEGPWTHPAAIAWLTDGVLIEAQQRPGSSFDLADHFLTAGYVPAIEALGQ